ncbi:MAG: hypothetical protein KBT48_05870 [Firmicutes bacterium]|nr:hypothetical protein [Bacillota bacterium]
MKRKVIMILSLIVLGITSFILWDNQKVFVGNIEKDSDAYILEFEKMNQTESHSLNLTKDDVLSVEYQIDQGQVDLVIGMEKEKAIYTGNDIDNGKFSVVVPKDGEYIMTIKAKNAKGTIKIYAK